MFPPASPMTERARIQNETRLLEQDAAQHSTTRRWWQFFRLNLRKPVVKLPQPESRAAVVDWKRSTSELS